MGRIYELFGVVKKDIADKIPCARLRTTIKSGNYGLRKNVFTVDSSNPCYKYLMNEGYRYNVVYWHNKILEGTFRWTDVLGQFKRDFGYIEDGFHPCNYGVYQNPKYRDYIHNDCWYNKRMSGLEHFSCDDCHKMCIEFLYRKYMAERRKGSKEKEG